MKATDHPRTRLRRPDRGPVLHLAVVAAPDRVLLSAIGPTKGAMTARLVRYIRSSAPHKLWATDAAELERLLAGGDPSAAIELYFARVGERWDPEFLYREAVVIPWDQQPPHA